ncbi:uncharacterized protein LOC115483019 [Drosophila hydei]|uniref:Uncharacterized protein LOC115483019 n=1 Tax=Drosophila hydei TaxID=7224 RepID=A0A6J2STV3_DROHY|nr:uncharacterized protein LOC115483019 [Drosophila hydei]
MAESLPRLPETTKIPLQRKDYEILAPAVKQQHSVSTIPVKQLYNEGGPQLCAIATAPSVKIDRQLKSDLDVVKEVKIELIESSVYNNSAQLTVEANVEYHIQENADVELSPTTDEYQEGTHFGSKDVVFDYDIIETERYLGYTPPAPTPVPSLAPLAVLEVDIVDEEPGNESAAARPLTPALSNDDVCRRRKKRNATVKKLSSFDERDKMNEKPTTSAQTTTDEAEHNAVCPWEDENVSTNDGTFVKTYATLGYL